MVIFYMVPLKTNELYSSGVAMLLSPQKNLKGVTLGSSNINHTTVEKILIQINPIFMDGSQDRCYLPETNLSQNLNVFEVSLADNDSMFKQWFGTL